MPKIAAGFVVLVAGMIGWLYWMNSRPAPFVVSGFIEADQIRVGSRVGGRVAKVMAEEGARVAVDAPLVEIDPFDLRERLAQAEARLQANKAEHARLTAGFQREEVEQARARRDQAAAVHEKLVAGPRPREIEIAREQLNVAKADLELAQTEYDRLIELRDRAQAAKTEYDKAVRSLKSARAEAAAAEQQLGLLEEGTRKEEIAQATASLAEADQALAMLEQGYRAEDIEKAAAQVAAADAEVNAIKEQLRELVVRSPCDCTVETTELRPGDIVAPNAPAISLLDLTELWVRAYVPESRLGQVPLGRRVPIRVDSFPNETFAARVTFIAREGEFTPRNIQTPEERSKQVFRIKVTLDEGFDRLRVGMSADVLLDEVDRRGKAVLP